MNSGKIVTIVLQMFFEAQKGKIVLFGSAMGRGVYFVPEKRYKELLEIEKSFKK